MIALPLATPVTTPVLLLTVAIAVLLLVQLPPGVALVKVIVAPPQTSLGPPIAATAGGGLTVTVA